MSKKPVLILFFIIFLSALVDPVIAGRSGGCCPRDGNCEPRENKKEKKCNNERIRSLITCNRRYLDSKASSHLSDKQRRECDSRAQKRYEACLRD